MIVKLTIGGSSKGDYSPLIQRVNSMSSLEFDLLQGRWLRSHNNVDWSLFSFGKVLVIFNSCARE